MEQFNPTAFHDQLNQFIGVLEWTRHTLSGLIYSEGVAYLQEHGKCYWLVDTIGSYFVANDKFQEHLSANPGFASLHFWKLKKEGDGAVLIAELDLGCDPVVRQDFEFTAFPFPESGEFTLYCGQDFANEPWKPFLPSEY